MASTRRYLHDRLILLLLTINSFLVILTTVLVLLRLDSGKAGGYIVEYRSSLSRLSRFGTGDSLDLLAFIIFGLVVFVLNLFISVKVYPVRRSFAIVTLALSLILLSLAIIVSNSLLVLR